MCILLIPYFIHRQLHIEAVTFRVRKRSECSATHWTSVGQVGVVSSHDGTAIERCYRTQRTSVRGKMRQEVGSTAYPRSLAYILHNDHRTQQNEQ